MVNDEVFGVLLLAFELLETTGLLEIELDDLLLEDTGALDLTELATLLDDTGIDEDAVEEVAVPHKVPFTLGALAVPFA